MVGFLLLATIYMQAYTFQQTLSRRHTVTAAELISQCYTYNILLPLQWSSVTEVKTTS
jgi:hypothetical protein